MELRHLRYFVAIAEALNFTKASARLRVAQPSLSRQMQDLEDEIGVDLLRRSPRGITLTAEGSLFLEEARAVLKRAEDAVGKVQALARGEYGELHIGYSPTPTLEILPPALAAFQKAVPSAQVLLHEMSGDEFADGLRSGLIHLAVTPLPDVLHAPDVEFESLKTYPICVALPRDHPLARLKSIPLAKFAAEPLVILSRKDYPGAHSFIEDLIRSQGLKPRIAQECDSSSSLVAALEAGRGIALTIPLLKRVTGNRLVYRPLTGFAETLSVGIARARKGDLLPAGEKFCELLRASSGSS